MKKQLLITLVLSLNAFFAISQEIPNVIAPSPMTSGFAQYHSTPVGTYTGKPEISLPIYNIEDNNVSIPISLSYDATGIKISQEASWVGLGWNLSFGGVITQNVKDKDDLASTTYLNSAFPGCYFSSYLNRVINNAYDFTADVFTYSFPGHSGEFVFDKPTNDFSIKTLDLDDVKITCNYSSSNVSFTIVDENGNTYEYNTKEINEIWFGDENNSNWGDRIEKSTNAWYLDRIITLEKDTISFIYRVENEEIWSHRNWHEEKNEVIREQHLVYQIGDLDFATIMQMDAGNDFMNAVLFFPKLMATIIDAIMWLFRGGSDFKIDLVDTAPNLNSITRYGTQSLISPVYIQEIRFNSGFVKFIPDETTVREDVLGHFNDYTIKKAHALSQIEVFNTDSVLQKSISFQHSYFNNSCSEAMAPYMKRLKLNSIVFEDDENKKYSFDYNEMEQLPSKTSNSFDYWGYYNGKNYEEAFGNLSASDTITQVPDPAYCEDLPKTTDTDIAAIIGWYNDPDSLVWTAGPDLPIVFSGANRTPDNDYLQLGILQKITYPTDGYVRYEYEPHTYQNVDFCSLGYGGGLRVKKIYSSATGTSEDELLEKSYLYYDGKLMTPVRFSSLVIFNGFSEGGTYYKDIYLHRTSSSRYPIRSIRGSYVGYDKVVEYYGDTNNSNSGKIEYTYVNKQDIIPAIPDITAETYTHRDNGLLLSKGIYKKNVSGDYQLVSKDIYAYGDEPEISYPLYSFFMYNISSERIECSFFDYYAQWWPMKVHKHIDYMGKDSVTSKKVYGYGNNHKLPIKITTTDSKGNVLETHNSYTNDISLIKNYPDFINALNSRNKINAPVFTKNVISINGKTEVLDAKFIEYYNSTIPKPRRVFSLDTFQLEKLELYEKQNEILETALSIDYFEYPIEDKTIESQIVIPDYHLEGTVNIQGEIRFGEDFSDYYNEIFNYYESIDYPAETYTDFVTPITAEIERSGNRGETKKYELQIGYRDIAPIEINETFSDLERGETITIRITKKAFFKALGDGNAVYNDAEGELSCSFNGKSSLDFELDTSLEEEATYHYDEHGNMIKVITRDGIVTHYLWGYNNEYPVAKIVSGAELSLTTERSNIANHSFSSTQDKSNIDSDVTAIKNILRNYIDDGSYQTIIYTYKPLFGITSETSPNNRTMYYKYDDIGRLEYVVDQDGHILKKHEYNYAN